MKKKVGEPTVRDPNQLFQLTVKPTASVFVSTRMKKPQDQAHQNNNNLMQLWPRDRVRWKEQAD